MEARTTPEVGEGEHELLRRVQRTGSASLTVTLPKWWTEAMGVRSGDALRFRDLGGGRLEVSHANSAEPKENPLPRTLSVDARGADPHFLSRIIVGAYITGHDQVVLVGRVSAAQRAEVARTVSRLLGTTIVEDEPDRMEVRNFVDPTHYGLPRLLGRMVALLKMQNEVLRSALHDHGRLDLERSGALEDEVDRIYRLMVRQLLLSSDNFRIAKEVGVPSHHFQMGYRVVGKALEEIGDLLSDTGRELGSRMEGEWDVPRDVANDLAAWLSRIEGHLSRTIAAFAHPSTVEANSALNDVQDDLPGLKELENEIPRRVRDKLSALMAQRLVGRMTQTLRMLVVIGEISINRSVEPEEIAGHQDRILQATTTRARDTRMPEEPALPTAPEGPKGRSSPSLERPEP
ncbi:MAG: phosphate uptake regulator PhoU [Euryarchaeota archaeon]|nr:phosphate uptake regulator PhoU [Euryarchaeota archaeon]